jgi:molybdopterin synthase catalytic subunit
VAAVREGRRQTAGTVKDVDAIRLIAIRDTELSVDEVRNAIKDPRAGAVAMFLGIVRDNDEDREVSALAYSAHPGAEPEMLGIAEDVALKHEVIALAAVHRTGDLEVGELAVIVGVAARHRGQAFDACREMIDNLKAEVPIWKHQRFADGSAEWVGSA